MSLSSILLRVATHEPDQTNNLSDKIFHIAQGVLNRAGFSHDRSDIWNRLLIFIAIIIVAYLAYFIFCKLLIKLVHKIIIHRSDKWEKFLFDRRFFNHIFGLVPPIIVLGLLPLAFSPEYAKLLRILEKLINIYIVIVIARIFISFIKGSYDYYLKRKKLTTSAYNGAAEMAIIIVIIIAVLLIAGILINAKITSVVTGMSAFAAVFMLIFKDTLLGFVAGIQLSQNNMINIGDWITVPNTNANGTVVGVTILTVKVQNFDNTYVFVPAYMMVTNAFQNWVGMSESGVRRVAKSVLIDIFSIKKSDDDFINKVYQDPYVKKYLDAKGLSSFEDDKKINQKDLESNLGLFRIWLSIMLNDDDGVSPAPYQIIQNLPAQGAGFPLNIIFFINTTDWATYENIQSRIFEKILCMMENFELRHFQFVEFSSSDSNPVKTQILGDNK